MKKRGLSGLLLLWLVLWCGSGCVAPERQPASLTQVSTIDALLAGVYDGSLTLAELKRHGSFGIGTFDRLDGELAMLDGVVYQVRADGRVYRPDDRMTTPFAAVTDFVSRREMVTAEGLDWTGLCRQIETLLADRNGLAAVRVEGDFVSVRTRSVPAQEKPYRPLAEVTPTQPEFALSEVRGVLAGFRLPPFVKGINVPGYHLHFLDQRRELGGHVLALEVKAGARIRLMPLHRFQLLLPQDDALFSAADLERDRGAELHRVEGGQGR